MALTSVSTQTEALAQLNNNLAWEGNPTKAADCLEAVRWLLFNRAQSMSTDGRSLNYEELKEQEKKISEYVAAVGTAAMAGRRSFTQARAV